MSIKVLGLESSCDDTAAAIVSSGPNILANIVISQTEEHVAFKGIVPEIAARSHLYNIKSAIDRCLIEASITLQEIDAIAATSGPGAISGVSAAAVAAARAAIAATRTGGMVQVTEVVRFAGQATT